MTTEEEWFRKFYDGTFVIKGWKQRTHEILETVPVANQEKIRERLAGLGEKIGQEWAKDNNVRLIDNVMLKQWVETLGKAKKGGIDALNKAISNLDAEVDNILLGKL